jgi:hypothetical protein
MTLVSFFFSKEQEEEKTLFLSFFLSAWNPGVHGSSLAIQFDQVLSPKLRAQIPIHTSIEEKKI